MTTTRVETAASARPGQLSRLIRLDQSNRPGQLNQPLRLNQTGRPVIEVAGLNVDLAGRRVLEDVSFAVGRGEFVGLLGPNGAGKTTLLRSILGLVPTAGGMIRVNGERHGEHYSGVSGGVNGGANGNMNGGSAARRIGYVPQRHQFAWDFPISVLDVVVLGRVKTMGWFRRPGKADCRAALDALERTDMGHLRDRPVGDLSGGQRQRVLVARALAMQPEVLLLDEPFTGLDMPAQELLTGMFAQLAREGETLIMSTHDIAGAVDSCSRILLLNRSIHADGRPDELVDHRIWCDAFAIAPTNPLLAVIDRAASVSHSAATDIASPGMGRHAHAAASGESVPGR